MGDAVTKQEAEDITEAIELIEAGRVELGARRLRSLLMMAGQRVPALRVIDGREPKRRPPA